MAWSWVATGTWLCHCAAGGGLLLLLVWALMRRARQPARQQRLGEYGVLAALLLAVLSLAPAWLVVPLPVAGQATAIAAAVPPASPPSAATDTPPSDEVAVGDVDEFPAVGDSSAEMAPGPDADAAVPTDAAPPPAAAVAHPANSPLSLASAVRMLLVALGIAYVGIVLLLAAHRLLGYIALRRLLRVAEPAPLPVARLAASLWHGRRPPRLLVSRRLRVPISCGVWRPTVVLPAALADGCEALPWVLAHELTHLERRDAWTCLLLSAGQVVYFYLPWFWWLRRRVGLCQEFVADAAVAALGADAADYAQFLLGLVKTTAAPAGTTGVAGQPSDLFQRVSRLMQAPQPVERRCPWLWSGAAAAGLALPAVFAAGVGLREVVAAPAPRAAQTADGAPAAGDQPLSVPDTAVAPRAAPPRAAAEAPPPSPAPAFRRPDARRAEPAAPWRVPNGSGGERLGVGLALPGAALRDQLDLPPGQGLVIEAVSPGSAAERGGLKPHDVLLALDGSPVPADVARLQARLALLRPDAPLSVTVLRHGHPQTALLRLPAAGPKEGSGLQVRMPASRAGDPSVITTVLRTGDRFSARCQDGPLVIELTGTAMGRGVQVGEVIVRRGGGAWRYAGLDAVPPAYRAAVRQLLEVCTQGSSRVRIHSS